MSGTMDKNPSGWRPGHSPERPRPGAPPSGGGGPPGQGSVQSHRPADPKHVAHNVYRGGPARAWAQQYADGTSVCVAQRSAGRCWKAHGPGEGSEGRAMIALAVLALAIGVEERR
jgi:hypothetical protein